MKAMGICYRLDHDAAAPVIVCDQCGIEIEGGGQNVLFRSMDKDWRYQVGAYVPAVFVHVECTRQYEAVHGHHAWNKLKHWLIFLKNNCGITKQIEREAIETIKDWASYGLAR